MARVNPLFGPIAFHSPLLEMLPEPIWVYATGGRVIYSNKAWTAYAGSDVESTNWLEHVHPEDRSTVDRSWASSADTEAPLSTTCRLRRGDGEYRWFHVQGRMLGPQTWDEQPVAAWLFSAYDVHEDKGRELALKGRLRSQITMMNRSIDCIKVIAPDGRLINMNRSGCLALGVPETSEFGMDWLSLLPEDVRGGGREALQVARRGETGRFPGRSELPGSEPRHWDNVLTPALNAKGEPEAILCLSRDVTVERRLEEQLRLSNRDLEARVEARSVELARLWEASLDLLLVLQSNGTIIRANPAWSGVLGYNPQEMIGRHFGDFLLPEDEGQAQVLLQSAATIAGSAVEIRHRHQNGSMQWVAWVAVLSDGEIYAVGRHVTAAKEAAEKLRLTEDALRHAQKVETVGRLTGSVAHDFNNLLSVIRNSLVIFRMEHLPEESRARALEVLTSATDRAIAVTRQLLDFARRSPFNPGTFDVAQRITGLYEMLAMLLGSGIRLELRAAEGQYSALADLSQFDSALVNLATNARDAMQGNGTLSIRIQPAAFARASWRRRILQGDFVAISVMDTGHGITEEDVEQIFEPYFTTKKEGLGTGLGLSQVVGFAEQSGGSIGVESQIGVGTTFTIYLPRASAPAATDAVPGQDGEAPDPSGAGDG